MNINFKEIKIKVINYYQNDQNNVKEIFKNTKKKLFQIFILF